MHEIQKRNLLWNSVRYARSMNYSYLTAYSDSLCIFSQTITSLENKKYIALDHNNMSAQKDASYGYKNYFCMDYLPKKHLFEFQETISIGNVHVLMYKYYGGSCIPIEGVPHDNSPACRHRCATSGVWRSSISLGTTSPVPSLALRYMPAPSSDFSTSHTTPSMESFQATSMGYHHWWRNSTC